MKQPHTHKQSVVTASMFQHTTTTLRQPYVSNTPSQKTKEEHQKEGYEKERQQLRKVRLYVN